jgi:hypothetical protein
MRQKKSSNNQKRSNQISDPVIVDALANLKKLVQSEDDRLRVIKEVMELRKKGVKRKVIAECCGVSIRTIGHWLTRLKASDPESGRQYRKRRKTQIERMPQMRIFDVVQSERVKEPLPKFQLRAEWAQIRLNFQMF